MKILNLILFIQISLFAEDPTIPKGKLKAVLDSLEQKIILKTKPKQLKKNESKFTELRFKGFYRSAKQKRLLLQFEKQILIVAEMAKFTLNEEEFQLQNFNDRQAQFINLSTNKTLTMTYRP